MTFMKNLLLISLSAILFSCANHYGTFSNTNPLDDNTSVVGIAIGKSETESFFGIGGLDKNALVFEAKKDLYDNTEI